ncbi:MAG: phage holin family protein [Armatimonadetes bacterium]|nr:phage holin family protein [Armatimonadota bacterium]MDE2206738.1 phage holin family protein [Armatimonadota bacterium]
MIRKWLIGLAGNALALFILAEVVRGIYLKWQHPVAFLTVLLVFSLVNSLVRPIIMFFVWPINCLTFGLLGFCLNVFLFFLVGQLDPAVFHVRGPISALIGSVLMGVISGAIGYLLRDRRDRAAE